MRTHRRQQNAPTTVLPCGEDSPSWRPCCSSIQPDGGCRNGSTYSLIPPPDEGSDRSCCMPGGPTKSKRLPRRCCSSWQPWRGRMSFALRWTASPPSPSRWACTSYNLWSQLLTSACRVHAGPVVFNSHLTKLVLENCQDEEVCTNASGGLRMFWRSHQAATISKKVKRWHLMTQVMKRPASLAEALMLF